MTDHVRIVFFGIYDIGVRALAALHGAALPVLAVVTKPDADHERQPVAVAAERAGLTVMQPPSPRAPDVIATIEALQPDLIAVAGYHRIIPERLLQVPRMGTINLHGSMLPRYRGPSTWKWAIINGETETGVTVHVMTPTLDTGDILMQRRIVIAPHDTGGSLFAKISAEGASLLAETIHALRRGTVQRVPQDEPAATYFGPTTDADGQVHWTAPAHRIANLVRGLAPSPGAWTSIGRTRIAVMGAVDVGHASGATPGTVLAVRGTCLDVQSGTAVVRVLVGAETPLSELSVGSVLESQGPDTVIAR